MGELAFIQRVLGDAATLVQTSYADRHALRYREKEAADILTGADLEVQQLLVSRLAEHFPGEAIVAEEQGLHAARPEADARCWIIDPIDGTYNFARDAFPIFGISLACAEGGVPLAGGVALPGLDQLYLAQRGAGATCNGLALEVSGQHILGQALVGIDFSKPSKRDLCMGLNDALARTAGQVRAPGCAVAGLCAVAAGRAEAHFDAGLEPWDIAAAALIVEEAGGRVSRADGRTLNLFDGAQGLLASNGSLHEALLDLLANAAA